MNTYRNNTSIPIPIEISAQKPRKYNNKGSGPQFSKATKQIFTSWLLQNIKNPYPTEGRIIQWTRETGLNISQIKTWFMNARRRDRFESIIKPKNFMVFTYITLSFKETCRFVNLPHKMTVCLC